MQNPVLATGQTSGYFIPPTLGDTWMYDFEKTTWNRVKLYGERYSTAASSSFSALSEKAARYSSTADDATTRIFSPPPLSGSIMITRTHSKANHAKADTASALAIPEVFLFGGRKKDGTYQLFNEVFKFCSGSTGEKPYPTSLKGTSVPGPDDASCDAYDEDTNPNSLSPAKEYTGRWLVKSPSYTDINPEEYTSFMGGGVYDSTHDLLVVYGGLKPLAAPYTTTPVTSTTNRTATSDILEYTPPSAVQYGPTSHQFNGYWSKVSSCEETPEIPTGRYGHSVAYDPLNESLIVVGGYQSDGTQLVQSQTSINGSIYPIPEVWTAYRVDSLLLSGDAKRNLPALTKGTFPCYYWKRVTTFGNSVTMENQAPPTTGISHAASVFIPPSGYNSGYYTLFDSACAKSGQKNSSDPLENKLMVGGAYIDIDRTKLGANENLILNLTFIPLGTSNTTPSQVNYTAAESAIFKVHLIRTGESGDQIRQRQQPRNRIYGLNDSYPTSVQDLAVISPPTGQIRQEQLLIPLSIDPGIDRIRIERYSGSAILIDVSVYRLGVH
jgi:hypothetical protein